MFELLSIDPQGAEALVRQGDACFRIGQGTRWQLKPVSAAELERLAQSPSWVLPEEVGSPSSFVTLDLLKFEVRTLALKIRESVAPNPAAARLSSDPKPSPELLKEMNSRLDEWFAKNTGQFIPNPKDLDQLSEGLSGLHRSECRLVILRLACRRHLESRQTR